jgi:hypothetical protein
MELHDTDEIKNELLRRSAQHRNELQDEVRQITAQTEKLLTNALIIGGSLLVAYLAVRQLTGSSRKPKSKSKPGKIKLVQANDQELVEREDDSAPGFLSQFGTALASQASVYLLTLAKEKLTEYLQSQVERKA